MFLIKKKACITPKFREGKLLFCLIGSRYIFDEQSIYDYDIESPRIVIFCDIKSPRLSTPATLNPQEIRVTFDKLWIICENRHEIRKSVKSS